MKYIIVYRAVQDNYEIIAIDETKDLFRELTKVLEVPIVEIVKTQRMLNLTKDENNKFMCMVIDDMGALRDNPVRNTLGSYLYGDTIVGDIALCKYDLDAYENVVLPFDSIDEALEWASNVLV